MTALNVTHDYSKKGYMAKVVADNNVVLCELELIKVISFKGDQTLDTFTKDKYFTSALNKILDTSFTAVFRNTRNIKESLDLDELSIEGELLILKSDNSWLHIFCSEWGAISLA